MDEFNEREITPKKFYLIPLNKVNGDGNGGTC